MGNSRPEWKNIVLQKLAEAVDVPGGSNLLRNVYAEGVAAVLGYQVSTVCKYVENILGKHHKQEW